MNALVAMLGLRMPAARGDDRSAWSPHAYLLILRFSIVNLVAFALVWMSWLQGWIATVYNADPSRLSVIIAVVFAAGLGLCAQKVWRTSQELNLTRDSFPGVPSRAGLYLARVAGRDAGTRAIAASELRFKLVSRIRVVRVIADSLVVLGLIGTVLGFIMALSGVDPDSAGEVSAISPMVSQLIAGMSVALYTTLVGAILSVWLGANYQILATGTVNLITEIVAAGERANGRP